MKNGVVHVCCADCGLKMIHALEKEGICNQKNLTLLFDNPNIHPAQEHLARQKALQEMFIEFPGKVVLANWEPDRYFAEIRVLQEKNLQFDVWNKKNRCPACWAVRIRSAFSYAKDFAMDFVTTTLVTSQYQDIDEVRVIGKHFSKKTGIPFLVPALIDRCEATKGFYKQNYCGCMFSLVERMGEKYNIDISRKNHDK